MTSTGAHGSLSLTMVDEEKMEREGKQCVLWYQCPSADGVSNGGIRRKLLLSYPVQRQALLSEDSLVNPQNLHIFTYRILTILKVLG